MRSLSFPRWPTLTIMFRSVERELVYTTIGCRVVLMSTSARTRDVAQDVGMRQLANDRPTSEG